MAAPAARPRTNRRVVYETLRRKVLTLELPPGTALSENELAAALGVSRTPVRESLILLADEGLVQVFPQVGTFVSRVDPDRVRDAQFLREAVELAALDDVPAELDPDVVAELRANLDGSSAPGIDLEEFFDLDEAFHHGLLRLSGHARAWSTVVSAKGHLDRARRLGTARRPSPTVVRRPARRDLPGGRRRRPARARAHDAHAPAGGVRRHRAASGSARPSCSRRTTARCRCGRNVVVWE